jgi:tRNA(Ile)-lysidine synthase
LRVLHHLAPELGLTLSVAHLDHGVRGEAARQDAEFVERLAGTLGLPFDLGHWQPERPGHFESRARAARYRWLMEIASNRNATAVAVGHTRDDQAETILHRIVRGTGLRGLAGIPARRRLAVDPPLVLVRPLLGVTRVELRAGLAALGQDFREDASNSDRSRTRARIRHDLLPRLVADFNPRVVEALSRLGTLALSSLRLLDSRLDELEAEGVGVLDQGGIVLDRKRLLDLSPFLRVELIRRLWRHAGWPEVGMSASRWRRLARLNRSERDVGAGVVLTFGEEDDLVILRRPQQPAPQPPARPSSVTLEIPGTAWWGSGRIVATLDPAEPRDETIDLDRVVPPLIVRGAVDGEYFRPLGMQGHGMPLNDFFRGRDLDPAARALTPLVSDAEGIVWVAGQRIADRVKLTDATSRRLGLRWEQPSQGGRR